MLERFKFTAVFTLILTLAMPAAVLGEYSMTMAHPLSGESYETGPEVNPNIDGGFGYNWFTDTYPYYVSIQIVNNNNGTTYFSKNAAVFDASYGTGTYLEDRVIFQESSPKTYTISAYLCDYYHTNLDPRLTKGLARRDISFKHP